MVHVVLKVQSTYEEVSKNWGPLAGSPFDEDHNMLGSTLGLRVYGNLHKHCLSKTRVCRPLLWVLRAEGYEHLRYTRSLYLGLWS